MKAAHSIGIDIGGTNTDIALVDKKGNCLSFRNLKTKDYYDAEKFASDIVEAVRSLIQENNVAEITGIGIGAPCVNNIKGVIDNASNLNMKGEIHLKQLIQKRMNVPVELSNDANAAAYGEMIYGGAQNMRNFIMFTIGTGIGSGIIIDGKMLYGADGFAGELGHAILFPEGRQCPCGRKGCLEQYVSIRGIIQTCRELFPKYPQNLLTQLPEKELDCKLIADEAHKGNPLAVETFNLTGYWLGIALANAVTFSSPEAIFVMGGPAQAGSVLFEPLRKSFQKHKLFVYKNEIPILESALDKSHVAILGAASLTR